MISQQIKDYVPKEQKLGNIMHHIILLQRCLRRATLLAMFRKTSFFWVHS